MGLESIGQTYVYKHLWRLMKLLFAYDVTGLGKWEKGDVQFYM